MTQDSNSPGKDLRSLSFPIRVAAIVFVLTATALWWWHRGSPRLVIYAGAQQRFFGFSPGGQSVLTHTGETPWFWDVHTGKFKGATAPKQFDEAVGFSVDNKRLFVGARYYDPETGKELPEKRYIAKSSHWGVYLCTESPDTKTIVNVLFNPGGATVGDANTGEVRFQVPAVTAVAFAADSKTMAAAVNLQKIGPKGEKIGPERWVLKLFDPMTGEEQRTVAEDLGYVNRMTFADGGNKLALNVWQEAPERVDQMGIQIWDVASGKREHMLPLKKDEVANLTSLRFLADGQVVSTAGTWGLGGAVWDLSVPPPDNFMGNTALSLPFTMLSADGRLIAIWNEKAKELIVRRLGNGKRDEVIRKVYSPHVSVLPMAFAPDGRIILYVNYNYRSGSGELRNLFPRKKSHCDVIDATSGRLLGTVPLDNGAPIAGISPDGRTLATHEFTHKLCDKITLWNVPTPKPLLVIIGGSLVPAAVIGLILRNRDNSRERKSSA